AEEGKEGIGNQVAQAMRVDAWWLVLGAAQEDGTLGLKREMAPLANVRVLTPFIYWLSSKGAKSATLSLFGLLGRGVALLASKIKFPAHNCRPFKCLH